MRIKATGYGLLDQYLLALFKPFDLAFLNLDCLVNLHCSAIEKISYRGLLRDGRQIDDCALEVRPVEIALDGSNPLELIKYWLTIEQSLNR